MNYKNPLYGSGLQSPQKREEISFEDRVMMEMECVESDFESSRDEIESNKTEIQLKNTMAVVQALCLVLTDEQKKGMANILDFKESHDYE